ncbi:MAG: hypothetical protein RBR15_09690 [Sphaerochaeta sp.]|nr:hypothetical protein [Sphaerochaeta sp.]
MAFIKVQKLVRNEDGSVRSGSASILTTEYDSSCKGLSRHRIREKLGKVVSLADDRKSGVFLSPTRGLVAYDSVSDTFEFLGKEDSRANDPGPFAEPEIHTVFGDAYLFLKVCETSGLLKLLRTAFPQGREYERVLSHLLYSVLKDGANISCNDFIGKSFASYLFSGIPAEALGHDAGPFSMMGDEARKIAFFKAFVAHMREKDPLFGNGWYIDATPLANTIGDDRSDALYREGQGPMTVVLVLDGSTGFPVWFSLIPRYEQDLGTLRSIMGDVAENLDIRIDNFILDAAYAGKELLEAFLCGNEKGKTLTVRMPATSEYPYKNLYLQARKLMGSAKYEFICEGHTFFGKRFETEIFGLAMHAYVYVDKDNALTGCRGYRQDHEDAYQKLTDKEKNWLSVRFGFFILLSTEMKEPEAMLDDCFGRTRIENSNHQLLAKGSGLTARGELLSDIISAIALQQLKEMLSTSGFSISELIGASQSLMCTRKRDGTVLVETPNKRVSELYHALKVEVPSSVSLERFKRETLELS